MVCRWMRIQRARGEIHSLHDLIDHMAQVTGGVLVIPPGIYEISEDLNFGYLTIADFSVLKEAETIQLPVSSGRKKPPNQFPPLRERS